MKGIQVRSNKGLCPLLRNCQNSLTNWNNLLSRTTGPISTKLDTMHLLVKWIQVCSNEGICFFPKGDNYKIAKNHVRILKISFSRTTEVISTKLGTNHYVKGIQVTINEGPHPFPRGDNYDIAKIH